VVSTFVAAVVLAVSLVFLLCANPARGAEVVPNEIQQPGTQPGDVGNLETPDKCDNCHGNSNKGVSSWRTSGGAA
jgi:hypothetical protein